MQVEYAALEGRAILTHNRADFERLFSDWLANGRAHCGIIIAVRRSPHDLARRVLAILNHVTADEMDNQIRYI